ncbi:MAG: transposase [Synergistaceae bacterium]|jgi:putative transposase|nr:transposase [Synergistaceae bacterium]
MRKRYSAEFKAMVAMAALLEQVTLEELAGEYDVHLTQVANWKKELRERASEIFGKGSSSNTKAAAREAELCKQISQLKAEVEWLKNILLKFPCDRKKFIESENNEGISVRRQCQLLDLNRSSLYYKAANNTKLHSKRS